MSLKKLLKKDMKTADVTVESLGLTFTLREPSWADMKAATKAEKKDDSLEDLFLLSKCLVRVTAVDGEVVDGPFGVDDVQDLYESCGFREIMGIMNCLNGLVGTDGLGKS